MASSDPRSKNCSTHHIRHRKQHRQNHLGQAAETWIGRAVWKDLTGKNANPNPKAKRARHEKLISAKMEASQDPDDTCFVSLDAGRELLEEKGGDGTRREVRGCHFTTSYHRMREDTDRQQREDIVWAGRHPAQSYTPCTSAPKQVLSTPSRRHNHAGGGAQ